MSGFRLRLRGALAARADLSGITPEALSGRDAPAVARLPVGYGAGRVELGELFEVLGGEEGRLVLDGDGRLDFVGAGLAAGEILVEGPVGAFAGAGMTGGRLTVTGDAGDGLASAVAGGRVIVGGAAGAGLGGALPGARRGMSGGLVEVAGDAGAGAGTRLRGGLILISGDAGPDAASDLIAGTLAVAGRLGPGAGRGMKRGSLLLARAPVALSPGFAANGSHDLVALRLLARRHPELAALFGGAVSGRATRFVGDRLRGGEGEVLILDGAGAVA